MYLCAYLPVEGIVTLYAKPNPFIGNKMLSWLKVRSAELMVSLIFHQRRGHRPSINFCFKSLLLFQFLFNHSDFFTRETKHIEQLCIQHSRKFNIPFGIPWILDWKKCNSSFSSYLIIQIFFAEKHVKGKLKAVFWETIKNAGVSVQYILQLTSVHLYLSGGAHSLIKHMHQKAWLYWRHIIPPFNKAGISNFNLKFQDFSEMLLLIQFLLDHSECFIRETR